MNVHGFLAVYYKVHRWGEVRGKLIEDHYKTSSAYKSYIDIQVFSSFADAGADVVEKGVGLVKSEDDAEVRPIVVT
jgi:hypothetical protein